MRRPGAVLLVAWLVVGGLWGGALLTAFDARSPDPREPGSGGGNGRTREPDPRKAPEVLPVGPFPGDRTTVDLPSEACRTDQDSAEAIEAFLAQVPNGSRVVFPRGARCRIDRSVDLSVPPPGADLDTKDPDLERDFRAGMVYDLNGATLFRPAEPSCESLRDCNGPIVAITLAWDVRLEGGTILGGGGESPPFDATREHDHGVAVHGASSVVLQGLDIGGVGGDCVDLDRQKRTYTHIVAIRGGSCHDAGRQGISANEVDGMEVTGVTFARIAASGVDLEPRRNGFITGARLEANVFGPVGHYAIAGIGASAVWEDIEIVRNRQVAHAGLGFAYLGNGLDRGPVTIEGNEVLQLTYVKHTSGTGTANAMAGPGGPEPCLFLLYNAPGFRASGNDPPGGINETCVIEADYGAWDGLFSIRSPLLLFGGGESQLVAEIEYLEAVDCAERDARLVVRFLLRDEVVGEAEWSADPPVVAEERVPLTVETDTGRPPDRVVVTQVAGDCV